MEVSHEARQIGFLEIVGPDAGIEAAHPEEDSVRPVLDRSLGAIPFPRRREDFGLSEGGLDGDGGHVPTMKPPCPLGEARKRAGAVGLAYRTASRVAPRHGDPLIVCMADKLEEIFRMQETLNKRIGVETAGMTEEEKIKWTLNYLRAMQQEMAELTDSVPWKWWAKYQKFDEQNARVEVIDLFHFLISIAQVLGMSADDVYQAYLKKNAVNHQRQDTGYVQKDENDSRHI